MTLATGMRLGHYEIVAKLGAGGMGEVWRATDMRLSRDVALKMLPDGFADDPERHARFEREAKVLASLNHPQIATLHALEHLDGLHVLVMELVDGETLEQRIQRGALTVDEALPIARQIAEALDAAHESGIVHRDLKPANVKVRPDGTVKVLDFGLAKALDATASSSGPGQAHSPTLLHSPTITRAGTQVGLILGTAAYMAPEQAKGLAVDKRADIWAFGVVVWEMVAGRRLFSGDSVAETLAGVLKSEIDLGTLPPATPAPLRRLLSRCLERHPRNRLRDIGEARIVIDELLAGGGKEPVAAAPAAGRWQPRSRLAMALFLAAAAALGALLAVALGARQAAETPAPRVTSELPLPERMTAPRFGICPALSPDGTRLALVLADEATQTRRIWIRNLATGDQRPVPGTESANYPFWSPDGRSLGFRSVEDDQLKRVDLDGGRPVPLAKADATCGAAWGRDSIVFCASFGAPLQRVSPSGGTPTPVTRTEKRQRHGFPAFLPDGERFVFAAAGAGREARLMLGSVDGGEPRALLASDTKALIADGALYYVRGETLLARPFDAAGGILGKGEPEIVAEGVDTTSGGQFTVAADLVVLNPRAGESGSRIAIYDRGGQPIDHIDSETLLDDLVLSSDGRQAAVMKRGGEGDGADAQIDVWTIDLARKVFNRATYGESDDDPVFSPDGRSLAFAHEGDLYRRPANGSGEPKLLVASDGDIVSNDWTDDGWIVYSDVEGGGENLFAVRADGGEPRRLTSTPFRQSLAQVSPDGRWLAYASNEGGDPQVYLTTWPGFEGKWRVSNVSAAMPGWGRGGRELYFLSSDSRLLRASIAAEGGEPRIGLVEELFRVDYLGNYFSRTARWAPTGDGERFLVLEAIPGESEEAPTLTLVMHPLALAGRAR